MSLGLCLCCVVFIYTAFGLKVMRYLSFPFFLLITGYWIPMDSISLSFFFFTLLELDEVILPVS